VFGLTQYIQYSQVKIVKQTVQLFRDYSNFKDKKEYLQHHSRFHYVL
jgi:hypothetical protein